MLKSTLISVGLALTLSTAAMAADYKIDVEGAHASINFEASHLGYSVLTGRFDTFDGNYSFDKDKPEEGTVSVEIDMNSVNSNHTKRDEHLRSADFFDVTNHPKATFTSTGIEVTGDDTAVVTGDLTLRGITKPVKLDTKFIGEGDDPWGGYRSGFTGTTTIQLGDFGMGGVIGDAPIKLIVQVEGIRQ